MSFSFVQTHRVYDTRRGPSCQLWTWAMMVSQCRFIDCKKYPTVTGGMDTREAVCVGGAGHMGTLYTVHSVVL